MQSKKFYAAKYHPTDFYTTGEGKKIFFNVDMINTLYDLPNDTKYPGHELINNLTKGSDREAGHGAAARGEGWARTRVRFRVRRAGVERLRVRVRRLEARKALTAGLQSARRRGLADGRSGCVGSKRLLNA
uniref:Uncharacterized protein n=1 Tax=Cucumis melo TaxID=3656 RepID=A0A9I9DKH5_CUCME